MSGIGKKTSFFFVSDEGAKYLAEILEKQLLENSHSYINVLYADSKMSSETVSSQLGKLREAYYNRLIIQEVKPKQRRTLWTYLGIKKRPYYDPMSALGLAIQNFIIDFRGYAENEEFHIVASYETSGFIERTLQDLGIERSKIYINVIVC